MIRQLDVQLEPDSRGDASLERGDFLKVQGGLTHHLGLRLHHASFLPSFLPSSTSSSSVITHAEANPRTCVMGSDG